MNEAARASDNMRPSGGGRFGGGGGGYGGARDLFGNFEQ